MSTVRRLAVAASALLDAAAGDAVTLSVALSVSSQRLPLPAASAEWNKVCRRSSSIRFQT